MNYKITCGIDEAGRGSWAGPVVAAAVVLPEDYDLSGLNDSKKLSKKTRNELFRKIISNYEFGVGFSSSKEIDKINILEATFLAMDRAINNLKKIPDYALIDGNQFPKNFPVNGMSITKGDQKIPSISAASVIAKVSRDNFMKKMSEIYPGYGWENNFGYGVKKHFLALKTLGITPIHRHSFKPIYNMLC
tara:strand:- start:994 stop:1563 length:570 start_codon:yes stop_codon:yes gene_type:complete